MCGRYTHLYKWRELRDLMRLLRVTPDDLSDSYNVAPTQMAPIVRLAEDGTREGTLAKWGLVPSWADDPKIGNSLINARGETVATKPSFRSAFAKRRCVVPVTGFYEWQKTEDGKQPWYIYRADGAVMAFAGMWERWTKGDAPVESFSIITTEPNATMAPIHNRMPVILEPEEIDRWLSPTAAVAELQTLLNPAADGVLAMHEVGTRVGAPQNNDRDLLARVDGRT